MHQTISIKSIISLRFFSSFLLKGSKLYFIYGTDVERKIKSSFQPRNSNKSPVSFK